MQIPQSTSPAIPNKIASSTFFQSIGGVLRPAGEKTIQFTKDAPLAAGATALSFAAFVSAITGSLGLITVFGTSAVALFACQIFKLMGIQKQ